MHAKSRPQLIYNKRRSYLHFKSKSILIIIMNQLNLKPKFAKYFLRFFNLFDKNSLRHAKHVLMCLNKIWF